MLRRLVVVSLALSLGPAAAAAQHSAGAAPSLASNAPVEAEQFAFLVGQWEVAVTPKATTLAARLHGTPTLLGTWKAWRALDGFGIEDELRIVDGSGNPSAFTHAVRFYDASQKKWTQTSLDVYRGRYTSATGEWANGEMRIRSVGRDAEGKPYVQRVRFYDITGDGFKYQADRSMDGERTWETAVLKMEAKRVAAVAPR